MKKNSLKRVSAVLTDPDGGTGNNRVTAQKPKAGVKGLDSTMHVNAPNTDQGRGTTASRVTITKPSTALQPVGPATALRTGGVFSDPLTTLGPGNTNVTHPLKKRVRS